MNLVNAGKIAVIGSPPNLDHPRLLRMGEQELLQHDSLQRPVIDRVVSRQFLIAEMMALVDTPLRKLIPEPTKDPKPDPGIKSGICIAPGPGIHRDSDPKGKSRIGGDPEMVGIPAPVVRLDPAPEVVSHHMD